MGEHVRTFRGSQVFVSWDDEAPNVLYLDRDRPTVMTPVDPDAYAIHRGRVRLGEIVFRDGSVVWGWRYFPSSNKARPSRKLHRDPLSAIRGRVQQPGEMVIRGRDSATHPSV